MLQRFRIPMIAVLVALFLVGSTTGVLAKTLIPANQYGPVNVTVTSRCPTATTVVNLPIDPSQNPPIKSITVSGNVNGNVHLYDKNGLINSGITGSAPYSFTLTSSDALQACITSGSSVTVSFQGQLNMLTGNWAGYTVEGFINSPNVYNRVAGSWQVPSVTCSFVRLENSDSGTWLGLGGAPNIGSSKIEQIGTEQACLAGIPAYYPVYENFPAPKIRILYACKDSSPAVCINTHAIVIAGDLIHANVNNRGNGVFVLSEYDVTQHWYVHLFQNEVGGADASVQYSAEWIEEAPAPSLTNFNLVTFTGNSVDGNTISLGGPSIQQLTTAHHDGTIMAQPSELMGSSNDFSVQFVNS